MHSRVKIALFSTVFKRKVTEWTVIAPQPFVSVCAHVHAAHMHVVHLSMQICSCMWRSYRWRSGVFLNHSSPSFLEQSLSLNLELDLARQAGWWAQESACLYLPTTGVIVHAVDKHARDLDSGCNFSSANTLPTEPFPQHLFPTAYKAGDCV